MAVPCSHSWAAHCFDGGIVCWTAVTLGWRLAVSYRPRHGQCTLSQSKWGLNNWKCEPLSKWGIGKNNKDIDCNQPEPAGWVWSLLITPVTRMQGGGSWKCWKCWMFSQLGSGAEHRTEQIWAELKQKAVPAQEGERGPAAGSHSQGLGEMFDTFQIFSTTSQILFSLAPLENEFRFSKKNPTCFEISNKVGGEWQWVVVVRGLDHRPARWQGDTLHVITLMGGH